MDDLERGWAELRNRCCADPDNAKRCVMVSRDDFAAAIRAVLEGLEPVAWVIRNEAKGDSMLAGKPLPSRADEFGWTETPLYDLSAIKEAV